MGHGSMSSLNCDSCRKRRIKCDKLQGGCSQCRRVSKTCPGYRDPLSVIFRDESSKVIRKAQGKPSKPRSRTALPAYGDSSVSSAALSISSVGVARRAAPAPKYSETAAEPPEPAAASLKVDPRRQTTPALCSKADRGVARCLEVLQTPEEIGKAFYIRHYLLRHAGEPKSPTELAQAEWVNHEAMQHIIVGLGLAGLTNLTSNHPDLRRIALEKRGMTLELLRLSLQAPGSLRHDLSIRNIILLAQFELVFGAPLSVAAANSHVTGCAAIIREQIHANPLSPLGLMDLLYCMFIPCQETGKAVPEQALGILGQCRLLSSRVPLLAELTDLATLIARFIDLSASERNRVYEDGSKETSALVRDFVDLETALAGWEARLGGWWMFSTRKSDSPPEAVFQGKAHTYSSMLVARTWNHYRWARILVGQMLSDLGIRYPRSAEPLLSGAVEDHRMAAVKRLADDILTSAPFHYRHPNLKDEDIDAMDTGARHGAGSAGVSVLLFHLKVAGGVSTDLWSWAFGTAKTIWGTMGTQIARSIMGEMESGRERVVKFRLDHPSGTKAA